VNDDEVRLARIALACLLEPGRPDLYDLCRRHGPVEALTMLAGGNVPERMAKSAAVRLAAGDPHRIAGRALARTERLGARVVIPEDPEWPSQLDDLCVISQAGIDRIRRDTYPPICLWVRGNPDLIEQLDHSVSVVGARAATTYGTHLASELAYGLAGRDWAVVSGGAFGIDVAAHRGALTAGGLTACVLACGIDRPYPAAHAGLFEQIAEDGLLLSEWPPGADPHRHRFLVRNRVIAALTRGTVMVEASARSGARQTLGRAMDLGRFAMAMPGPVTSAMSVGCHEALRGFGVRLVTGYEEVLEEVGAIGLDLAPTVRGPLEDRDRLGPDLSRVLDAVPTRGVGTPAEIVAAEAGLSFHDTVIALSALEEVGQVTLKGGHYVVSKPMTPPP
jgi:DNA processing protein